MKEKLFIELSYDEGIRLDVYNDSVGIPTVGIGFNLKAHNTFPIIGRTVSKVGETITLSECMKLFDWSLENVAIKPLEQYEPLLMSKLSPIRKRALINLCFNLGITKLLQFKQTLYYLSIGCYDKSAQQLKQSKWYKQVGKRGPRIVNMIKSETLAQDYINNANNYPTIIYP